MSRFLVHWFVVTLALGATAWMLPGVHVSSLPALLVGGLVLGLVNALVRPVLAFLTLPITLLTLGLFYLVVNGAAFGLAAWLVPGFWIDTVGSAVLGALLVSVISWFVGLFFRAEREEQRKK
jgi:putative membrane protein